MGISRPSWNLISVLLSFFANSNILPIEKSSSEELETLVFLLLSGLISSISLEISSLMLFPISFANKLFVLENIEKNEYT